MTNNLKQLFQNAKTSLSPLGMSLFYAYVFFIFLGGSGVIFGMVAGFLKLTHYGLTITSPWWEIISLTLICIFLIKVFRKEIVSLVGTKIISNQNLPHNVIPFRRKPTSMV